MQTLSFWYDCIGKLIDPTVTPELALSQSAPTRLKKGVGMNRLGAGIDLFYIATPGASTLIGKLEMKDRPGLSFVPSEDVSGEKFIAQWLINSAPDDSPWMIGMIGNANPAESLKVSHPLALCRFCGTSSGFDFDLRLVREAVRIIGKLDWKAEVAGALHGYQTRLNALEIGDLEKADREGKKLTKLFGKQPSLKPALVALCKLPLKPNSGEYQVLSWYNRVR